MAVVLEQKLILNPEDQIRRSYTLVEFELLAKAARDFGAKDDTKIRYSDGILYMALPVSGDEN